MEYEDQKVKLKAGDLHVVPKGVNHNPVADDECLVILIENKKTLHTGENHQLGSCSIEKQLRY